MAKDAIKTTAEVLLVIGGLNWGLGIWGINLVSMLLGTGVLANIVYGLVGLSAVYKIFKW